MKINPLGEPAAKEIGEKPLRGPAAVGNATVAGAGMLSSASKAVTSPSDIEKIELSEASVALNQLSSEPFDAAKVAEIRKAISEGRFNVNAERVADRMINDAAELIVRIFGADTKAQR